MERDREKKAKRKVNEVNRKERKERKEDGAKKRIGKEYLSLFFFLKVESIPI